MSLHVKTSTEYCQPIIPCTYAAIALLYLLSSSQEPEQKASSECGHVLFCLKLLQCTRIPDRPALQHRKTEQSPILVLHVPPRTLEPFGTKVLALFNIKFYVFSGRGLYIGFSLYYYFFVLYAMLKRDQKKLKVSARLTTSFLGCRMRCLN